MTYHFICVLDMEGVFLNIMIYYCTNFMRRNTKGRILQYCQSAAAYLRAYSVMCQRCTRPWDKTPLFIPAVTRSKEQNNLSSE